jgi:hypothetical protein
MEVLTQIPVEFEMEEILARLHVAPEGEDAKQVAAVVAWAKSVANPKAVYEIGYVDEKTPEGVTINGTTFASRVLRVNLDTAHRVFPYIITCGTELENAPSITGDMMEFYWLDELKHVALGAAYAYMQKHLQKKYRPGNVSHMAPGSLEDWPITQQTQLFSLFGKPEEMIGVRLTETFLMHPTKSVSGIMFPTEVNFESCQLCPREGCPGRRAKYDKELWQKYQ